MKKILLFLLFLLPLCVSAEVVWKTKDSGTTFSEKYNDTQINPEEFKLVIEDKTDTEKKIFLNNISFTDSFLHVFAEGFKFNDGYKGGYSIYFDRNKLFTTEAGSEEQIPPALIGLGVGLKYTDPEGILSGILPEYVFLKESDYVVDDYEYKLILSVGNEEKVFYPEIRELYNYEAEYCDDPSNCRILLFRVPIDQKKHYTYYVTAKNLKNSKRAMSEKKLFPDDSWFSLILKNIQEELDVYRFDYKIKNMIGLESLYCYIEYGYNDTYYDDENAKNYGFVVYGVYPEKRKKIVERGDFVIEFPKFNILRDIDYQTKLLEGSKHDPDPINRREGSDNADSKYYESLARVCCGRGPYSKDMRCSDEGIIRVYEKDLVQGLRITGLQQEDCEPLFSFYGTNPEGLDVLAGAEILDPKVKNIKAKFKYYFPNESCEPVDVSLRKFDCNGSLIYKGTITNKPLYEPAIINLPLEGKINYYALCMDLNGDGEIKNDIRVTSRDQVKSISSDLTDIPEEMIFPILVSDGEKEIPKRLDLRSYMSPIRVQTGGTCWAYSIAAAIEGQVNYWQSNIQIDLSEQFIISCLGRQFDHSYGGGSLPETTGVVDERCLPDFKTGDGFSDKNFYAVKACEEKCTDWRNRAIKTKTNMKFPDYSYDNREKYYDTLKHLLFEYGPFDISAEIDMYAPHAMALVGYDDVQGYWILKNSWGADYGDNGYMLLNYDDPDKFIYNAILRTDVCMPGE